MTILFFKESPCKSNGVNKTPRLTLVPCFPPLIAAEMINRVCNPPLPTAFTSIILRSRHLRCLWPARGRETGHSPISSFAFLPHAPRESKPSPRCLKEPAVPIVERTFTVPFSSRATSKFTRFRGQRSICASAHEDFILLGKLLANPLLTHLSARPYNAAIQCEPRAGLSPIVCVDGEWPSRSILILFTG